MKKLFFAVLIALAVLTLGTAVLAADDTGMWEYQAIDGGVMLTKYNGDRADVYIPNKIEVGGEKLDVISIGSKLFDGCLINSATLGEGITTIGDSAFENQPSLVCIVTPESLTTIGSNAFSGCTSFNSVILYDGVTSIGENAFANCSRLTIYCNENTAGYNYAVNNNIKYSILNPDVEPETITIDGIEYYIQNGEAIAISFDQSTTEVVIPAVVEGYPVTELRGTFNNCSTLTSVTIPDSVTSIGGAAFYGCSSLTNITIPNSVTSIGDSVFYGCRSLTNITIPESVISIGDLAFCGCDSLTSITIPGSVTSIGDSVFYGCRSLTSITIPESVTSIGDSVFYGCRSLTNITIHESVISIGDLAFCGCDSLTSITIPGSVTSIGGRAFSECSSLTNVTLLEGVTTIGSAAFSRCFNLVSVIIPKSVNELEYAFSVNTILCVYENSYAHTFALNNNRLYFITDGSTFPDIYKIDGLYYYISNDTAVVLSFDNSRASVVIPNEINGYPVTDIRTAFEYSDSLTNITIPEGVTTIGSNAFDNCHSLTSITIPDSVTSIGGGAFIGCHSLTNITIPDSVTSIGAMAFRSCDKLTALIIPKSVISIGAFSFDESIILGVYENSYAHTFALNHKQLYFITDGSTLPDMYKIDGVNYFILNDRAVMVSFDNSVSNVVIPNEINGYPVTDIGTIFQNSDSLVSVTIPDSVTSIGSNAFEYCSGLTSITIPDSVTSIGGYAFSACSSLTNITIPDGVTSIGFSAFYYCSSLTSVTIPDSVTSIGDGVFCGCKNLTSVTIPEGVTSIGTATFASCGSLTSITIPESVTIIGNYAFDTSGLTSVTIPGNVARIQTQAFRNCISLRNVIVMDGVTAIESRAFEGADLRTVTIPESVTSLQVDSFPANTILCVYENSYAHKFAVENDLLYFIIRKTGNPEISFGTAITGTVTYTGGAAESNATVEILYDDGTIKESVVTDENGNYEFTYAEVGRYTIKATDSSGNTASEVISVKRMNVFDVYLAGETDLVLKKGYSISGNVSPETATLILTDSDGNVIESITTTNGSFVFENITNGSYVLKAETENGIAVREITVFNSDVVLDDIIIEAQGATVTGCVEVSDREDNLHRRGWVQVTIYNSDGIVVGSTKSDSEGGYTFTKLPLGEYSIVAECTEMRPDKKKGYDRSHTLTGYGYVNITEETTYTVNIVLYEENDNTATITGKVTAHGEHQACEVILTNVFRHEIARYETGKNGKYTFKNVRDGMYFITAVTESDGMGFAVVVVKDGKVHGETDITVYKHDRIIEHENKMNEIPYCADRDDALMYKDKIAEEKRFYDSLSEKEKKQFSKSYRERLNKLCEWIADCEYTENGGTLDRGGMIISGDELEGEKEVKITLNVSPHDAHEIGDAGIQNEADFIQQSIEDTAGHRTLVQYYDITLTKNGQSIKNIAKNTDTTGKVRITMPIPDEYKGHKKYTFVHVHNGHTTTLADLDNNPDTITFEIDKFSIFALCYSDEDETPHTADIEYNAENGKISVSAAEAATLYIAEFSDGKFGGIKVYGITANAEPVEFEFTESHKAFVFDADMIPLCEKFETQ